MKQLLYGVAYYDEYMPYDRLETDIQMMKDAGINVVRIAESTWSTHEPQNGVFDFTSVNRVLDAMHKAGISVIVGTPTYSVPTWMVKEHPDVLAVTKQGKGKYGARQIMDITNPTYLFYAERIIRRLMENVKDHPAIIGYQIDNETKHYDTSGPNVQHQFVKYLNEKFNTTDALNKAFGLAYWSNDVHAWEDMPSVVGTINGSLGAEFSKFQRKLVDQFLAWQVEIVKEYRREGQFITQNFDFEWRGYSFGVQPNVNHFTASEPFDITGVDIYHPSQDDLTGMEISFGGDIARSTKQQNYLVLETEAQAFTNWTPYPGQLRLQAFSHVASGANMVAYWHWHSIHNSFETYWKGLLSHDFQPNPVYNEAKTIGADFKRLSPKLVNLKKKNRTAILVSNEALTGVSWFKFNQKSELNYNDIFRLIYDELYKLNIECDIINPDTENLNDYSMIIVPCLYVASDQLLERLNQYVEKGGHAIFTFKSGFTNEHIKVRTSAQPGIIEKSCGVQYQMFVEPKNVKLLGNPYGVDENHNHLHTWMELLTPTTAEVLATYDHPTWGEYAAITGNEYGKGFATYIGCIVSPELMSGILAQALKRAGIWNSEQEICFPMIVKSGVNEQGKTVKFIFNYSSESQEMMYPFKEAIELVTDKTYIQGDSILLKPWSFMIFEVK
ncbi:beta-galactosidase [Bacillus sp. SA1-12]|uniref:beta-galactosidase n=1 Tax=Bacillus sp. SA1-12 TaxID=1455638 RepID=UPI0006273C16|nr:beta-galactosidase [Bacillus sp. SA1-12]KKI89882.1 beta-galactosidase [Bacillus sp. SA1-12]